MELGPTFPTLTIPAFLARETAAHGTEIILRKKDRGIWNALDWSTLNTRVSEIGQGLLAAGLTTVTFLALPAIWRGGRRVDSWSSLRKAFFTVTVFVYLAFSVDLGLWGALSPWGG